ncbi:MAG: sugar ABC transporter substrate-binding protein [Halanaerobiaceae bacterium]
MKKIIFMLVLMLVLAMSAGVAADELYLGTSIRSLDNPYHAQWKEGGEMFTETLDGDVTHRTLLCEGSDETQIDDIRSLVSSSDGNAIFNIDPNTAPNVKPIVELLEEEEIYFVTNWNKPEELHPEDFDYWVAHVGYDNENSGYRTAVELFESIGGEGEIIAIEGMLANTSNEERVEGLEKALEEYPDIEMVEKRPADWSRSEAYDVTQNLLLAYPGVKGIWAANDAMALGVVEALREQGVAGKIPVTGADGIDEAFEAIREGEMVATAVNNAHWQGGIGLSIAYAAETGELNPSEMKKEEMEWVYNAKIVTPDNVDDYLNNFIENVPEYDYDQLWSEDPAVK